MNTSASSAPSCKSPLLRIISLLARMRQAFPECNLSLGLLWDWAGEQLGIHKKWTSEARAIDDEMERVAPLLAECLQNDPPAKRKAIWLAWKETHARTERLAQQITPAVQQ